MFESADLMRIKLDLLKGVPAAYSSLMSRLYREGLAEMDGVDEARQSRLCGILDDYYDQYILRA
ncbi:MAG: hypothetical protein HQL98_07280 [Magnetococcales bacterium]|nr:hypothetical protein [Magnetococcales bacterium]